MHNQNILIASLNINGLNNRMKQLQLIDFMKYNKISILLIQEHNIRDKKVISTVLKATTDARVETWDLRGYDASVSMGLVPDPIPKSLLLQVPTDTTGLFSREAVLEVTSEVALYIATTTFEISQKCYNSWDAA